MLNNTAPSECEVCPNTEKLTQFMGMWMCPVCKAREIELQEESKRNETARIEQSRAVVEQSRAIDASIELVGDIFNANVTSINELKLAIDSNPEIPSEKKALALAEQLHERLVHYQKVIFDARNALSEAGNASRAIQQYMNTLANTLRAEDRERLKLSDITYKPETPKIPKTRAAGTRGPRKTSVSKTELIDVCAKFNVPLEMVRVIMVQKGLDVEKAAILVAQKMHGSH